MQTSERLLQDQGLEEKEESVSFALSGTGRVDPSNARMVAYY